jgi:MurNAc alpha-1-phosphate uridylyltransferase
MMSQIQLPVAILAGGLATRLHPRTERMPKSLLEVADRPFIFHQLQGLRARGIARVVLCVGHLGEMIEREIGSWGDIGIQVSYSYDGPTLLGTGGALRKALPLLGAIFFVLYGDSYLDIDYAAVEAAFCSCGKPALMVVYKNSGEWDTSNVLLDEGTIARYDKKNPEVDMEYIDYGLGVLTAGVFKQHEGTEALDLSTVYESLAAEGKLAAFEVTHRFYEIGSPSGLHETDRYLRARHG